MKNKIEIESIKIDEIHTRYVKKMGNGAIIYFFKEHIGKKVYIIIPKEKDKKNKSKRKT
jgi:putative transposon-encoded protein